jgi:hypothetical protein
MKTVDVFMLHVTFAYVLYRYIFFLDLYSSHLHNFIPTEENMQWYTDLDHF